jgi:hypothetical protein
MQDIIKQFKELFSGLNRAYGIYTETGEINSRGKAEGKPNIRRNEPTDKVWEEHLNGNQGIGIIPIRDDSTVSFGAIDIDSYSNFDLGALAKKIYEAKLPLIVCRSKSGGAHVYCFTQTPVSAGYMQEKLKQMAAFLGHSKNADGRAIEIFPKQSQVIAERGDIGGWINMPYLDYKNTNRYAINCDGKILSAKDFLVLAFNTRATLEQLDAIKIDDTSDDFSGAPPCLQLLVQKGEVEDCRNNFLYALGVFAKKKFEDTWENKLEEWNYKFNSPALLSAEIQGTIKSLRKKDYKYCCDKEPIQGYCNASLCRTRKFGIGDTSELPEMNSLTKLLTSPPIFFWSGIHNGKSFSLELTTEDLQNPTRFQKKCIETLNFMPGIPKKDTWQMIIQEALDNVNEISMPEDSSSQGQLIEHLETFCTSRGVAKTKDEILLGKPWTDGMFTYFRMKDFSSYLERQHFRSFQTHQISAIIKNHELLDTVHSFFNIKGTGVNVWRINSFAKNDIKFEVPKEIKDQEPPY